jgi:ferredoxin-NADP reductase/MOSC domain-containing protein YiiM
VLVPRLLAVSVGMPKDVPWRDATVHTGIWKHEVAGPRMARKGNLDGDGQGDLGGHGGEHRAVLAYQIDSYRYWREQLSRDDFVYGQFGENFTIDGLPDDQVCIGDRYRIGEAEFEVSQPRVTCYRVGLRMDEPRMAALLVAHGRPGFYLRVRTEGRVEAGNEIVKVASGPERMTVAEMSALLYLPGHPRDQLVRALRIPQLSPGWKTSLRALLDQAESGRGPATGNTGLTRTAGGPPPAWAGFRPLRVAGVDDESRTVFSVRLAAGDGAPLPAALPGQFLTLRLHPEAVGPPLIRSYSLSGRPGDPTYRISVKQEPHGAASGYLRSHLRAGDTLEVAAPRGTFTLAPGDGPVLLVSAGIGATPTLAMLQTLAAERSTRQVWWLHGARDGTEHAFARESRALIEELPNAHACVCYSRPGAGDRQGVDYTTAGRLSARLIDRLGIPRDADAYLCGPPSFMRELAEALVALGVDAARVRTETFTTEAAQTPGVVGTRARPPHVPAGQPGAGTPVSFARSGLTVNWDDAYASLLELAEACDVPVRWACRTGLCHTCETGLLSGAVAYQPEPVDQPAEGNALICCSQPQGDLVLDL